MSRISLLICLFWVGVIQPQNISNNDSIAIEWHHQQFTKFLYVSNDLAQKHLDSIYNFSRNKKDKSSLYYYHFDSGMYHFNAHDLEKSLLNFEKAYGIATEFNLGNNGIDAKIWQGNLYYLRGDLENSQKIFEEILSQSIEQNYIPGIAGGYNGLAMSEKDKSKELALLIKVDSIYTHAGIVDPVLANTYSTIGKIFMNTYHNKNIAKEYFSKSLQLSLKTNYYPGITYNNHLLGELALMENNYPEAYEYFEKEYDQYIVEKDSIKIARTLAEIASLDLATGKFEDAETKLKTSIKILKDKKDSIFLTKAYTTLSEVNLKTSQFQEAKLTLDTARKIQQELKSQYPNYTLLKAEINYSRATGDYQDAFVKQITLDSLKNTQLEEENREAFLALERQFNVAKKEQEIIKLTSQNQLAEQQRINQRNILLGVLALTVLSGSFFFFQYRNRQKVTKKLRELDTAKSTFFANISHEFRTPLSLIKGPIEDQLQIKTIPTVQRKNLLSAQRNTYRLEVLVEQLLALSKFESGNLQLYVKPSNLSQFIDAQAEAFLYACIEKRIDFQIEIEPDEETSWFDMDILENILYNLLGNALKYTPENGKITIKGVREPEHYSLKVSNTGTYLEPQHLQAIFKRFYQTDPQNPGSGIGLALSKELVELHKGTITVVSKENGTTTFSVKIPVVEKMYKESEKLLIPPQQNEKLPLIPLEGIYENSSIIEDAPILLIVDDSNDIRQYVSTIFESTYTIMTASNGAEGFEKAMENIPDLVLSDVMMPIEDGFALTKKLKENQLTSHIPVILLTARTKVTDKLEGIDIGADAYITKPFSSQLVKATVANLIESRRKLQQRFSKEVILKPREISFSSADEQFLDRLQKVIDTQITNPTFSIEQFNKEMQVSRMQLHRKLKALTGQSTTEFLKSQRLLLAANLLTTNSKSISEIGYTVGFNDPSYFSKCFKEEHGCSPSEYAKK